MAESEKLDVSKLTDIEIKEKIDVTRRELFDLRFQRATRQLNETHRFKKARVQLAQLLTAQGERSRSNT
ncbi:MULTISPECIES: 50S ribosomal protein L29 [Prochlorococcus]|uniref:Large ribosomal subunit protein uL29 n=1 Tax=Prochlorococcus marinus (strain SARG / CCMP1375 / SS120) TaxID=167539 RepID=RL29_PROMA|nr:MULTISPECIES: 50S ribosomal protein L29 [Prochlorococcus]Q7V9X0.1 RecName: Full=Large ribosomal subunit protein uL29; AltName: Full=50S ribosomal protein L29 [Prochlorococcus marinus subsp. marinus str. CCMP1375]AAQ00748.1 Ribosomal protein L29 [Prochlorococcus marinus subsp. marinus str. CCMP1375]KGG10756.1 LSU ribosomal protein L29p (L35e) [Prochlorococcus marinus str. LG]KGG21179.1 LSU ribosomal protein L29p (L35e) [Prochlorococcus marinus str. SS2]KGG24003.1 LSU ribosomal protein L29p (